MKNFLLKNKVTIILCSIILILLIGIFAKSFGMDAYESVEHSLGIVNTDYLNMRSGAGIDFTSIDLLNRNEYVRIFGKIGDWYIIQNEENQIGTAHSKYINLADEQKAATTNSESIENVSTVNLTSDETALLSIINEERAKNNLPHLEIDESLQNVAKLKANDLVQNNYFSHISPTYGTPFEMLKSNNISYKTASENIAGNSDIKSAFDAWISSESHKANILSNEYNYTGIAVVDSIAYGKVIVELFVGK
jgi:uncharacterized protein YkwD